MRAHVLLPAAMVLGTLTACDGSHHGAESISANAVPTTINCGDAQQLLQRATADRQRVAESRSDHERIATGSRANFLASLAVIANLKCRGTVTGADDSLKAALAAAGKAAATNSVYEKTRAYQEATFLATRVIDAFTAKDR